MPLPPVKARSILLADLNDEQMAAVSSDSRRLLVVAGAGSGKTEVMARRVAWWISIHHIPRDEIVAFTFTEAAAEELKFRIRTWLERISEQQENPTLGRMYVGTIHGFCLQALREFSPDEFYMYDVVDDAGRMALIEQGFHGVLGLQTFQRAAETAGIAKGRFRSQELFLRGYDLLNEYGQLDVSLPEQPIPTDVTADREWCRQAVLTIDVGKSDLACAFSACAARYYAYLRARRFLDFSTIQSELVRRLEADEAFGQNIRNRWSRLVVDEVQDINPVQNALIRELVGHRAHLTAVGDHRQAIYSFRGGRVDLMGNLFQEFDKAPDGYVQELPSNYRSTPPIIDLSNKWSETIQDTAGMTNPPMEHRRVGRFNCSEMHVAQLHFQDRDGEARWIADAVATLVPPGIEPAIGAFHDDREGARGLTLSDIAILVRSGTDIRTYQDALRAKGIPAVVRGGPDLFSQPEVLLFLGALALCAGLETFYGNPDDPRSLPGRIQSVLRAKATPEEVISASISELQARGIHVPEDVNIRLQLLCRAIKFRLACGDTQPEDLQSLDCAAECRRWLVQPRKHRRIFPQTLFHWLLREAGIARWQNDDNGVIADSAMFHVGQLSTIVKAIETSGWTPADSFRWQLIALLNWGQGSAKGAESPLFVSPDAVNITTIHSAKGLEYGAVFLADVCARRFPNSRARSVPRVPFDEGSPGYVDPRRLADNDCYDDERRLMYVALTRAERYLFISASGKNKSQFFSHLSKLVHEVGGQVIDGPLQLHQTIDYHVSSVSREDRMATNFSDLRYYLECPKDFYLRNVLGFTPTIGQEFGYGRGLHNLLRIVHTNPRYWAELASDRYELRREIQSLVDRGMFYLRYTVGYPLANLQNRAIEGVVEYVEAYAAELSHLEFEPEKEFETLIAGENLLISGAIDVVRLDDPPKVSIIDFKSGDAGEETGSGLSRELMALQIGVYGLAAKEELEYDPRHGLIRYIGERDAALRQVDVALNEQELAGVRSKVIGTARNIRQRHFNEGPTSQTIERCGGCDFRNICPRPEAARARAND